MRVGRQPLWPRFLPDGVVLGFSLLGPLGRWRAPGTWGSLAGVVWFAIACARAGPLAQLLIIAAGLYLAYAICGEAERRLARIDPPEVILDEFFAMPLALVGFGDILATGDAWVVPLLGFGLFRFFDILKPFGIRQLQRYAGGLGIVLDDIAAAVAAGVCLHLLLRLTPLLEWLHLLGRIGRG